MSEALTGLCIVDAMFYPLRRLISGKMVCLQRKPLNYIDQSPIEGNQRSSRAFVNNNNRIQRKAVKLLLLHRQIKYQRNAVRRFFGSVTIEWMRMGEGVCERLTNMYVDL